MTDQVYVFRPPTQPIARSRSRQRQRSKQERNLVDLNQIQRPQQNFFKIIFGRDKYLWVIIHKSIRNSQNIEQSILYNEMKKAYISLKKEEHQLPIFTDYKSFKDSGYSKFDCRVAFDESSVDDLDAALAEKQFVTLRVVNQNSIDVVLKIRKSPFGAKVRSIEDNYDDILASMKEDMQRVKVTDDNENIQKIRLPNFMRLSIKDKADLISYRRNIYGLSNLNKNKNDMENSKTRFLEQCRKQFTDSRQQKFINYYQNYPFNDEEILRLYTEDCFFYRCLNNTLRVAKTTEQFFVIGDPFNKMFHAIKNIYKTQYPYSNSRKNYKLYRGADLSPEECAKLKSYTGSYIQIYGFVSTTQDLQVAKKFAKSRNHNRIIEIIFEDIKVEDPIILQNDYGFVNLKQISKFQEDQILFNTLNVFKVVSVAERDGFQFFTLQYGSLFNLLGKKFDTLKSHEKIAYCTYRELMGEKNHLEDIGQVFLKSYEPQKSVDYYQAKILEAKSQNRSDEVELIIKKSEALLQNGEPARVLESMMVLMTDRGSIKKTSGGKARFLQSILSDKGQIIKQIDITRKYTEAGHSLDKFEDTESKLKEMEEAIEDALKQKDGWDFDIAFSQVQMKMKTAYLKQATGHYSEMAQLLRDAERLADQIIAQAQRTELSFHNIRQVYLQKTLIYMLLAKISSILEGEDVINIDQLDNKYTKTESDLLKLIEDRSYDKSVIQIRKIEIMRRRADFSENKKIHIQKLQNSLISIKVSATRDDQIPKTYHMLGQIQKDTKTVSSTNKAITYFDKEYISQTQYYGEHDPRSMKTAIDIAQCHRDLKDPQQSINLMKEQIKLPPFKNNKKHTIITKQLYMMGMAYLDLGEFTFAIKCLEKALFMLQQFLTKNDYNKYHHRFKIQMQMGRVLTFLTRYNEAQEKLTSYHTFIIDLYKGEHSDIANSLNHFAILYLKWKKMQQSKKKFQESSEMFRLTSGEKSIICAKIQCNLGLIYAIFNQKDKALRSIDNAKALFNLNYLKDASSQFVHRQTYMIEYYYAEIYRMFKDYPLAQQFYRNSLKTMNQFKKLKKEERQSINSKITNLSTLSSKYFGVSTIIQSKRDHHQMICRVKLIECLAKQKKWTFHDDLKRLILELQKESKDQDDQQNPNQNENEKVSQLKNLLSFCKEMQTHYQKKIRQSKAVSVPVELEDQPALNFSVDKTFNSNIRPQTL